jgi:energy-coupling factor transport system permease protein
VIARLGSFLGRRYDVTLEAVAFGGVAALRIVVLVMAFALFSAAVDPDELMRSLRRISYRSALTAALASRLVPVLARDASRMSEAARCRPRPPGRTALARAALGGALERSLDLAAALEVRGYAGARRPARVQRRWSRHDVRITAAALALAAAAIAAKLAGAGGFDPYPTTHLSLGGGAFVLAAALPLIAVLPFATPHARMGVARA